MTSSIAGYGGSITGLTGVTEVKDWEAKLEIDLADATSMASQGWKEFVPTLMGGTGTAKCIGDAVPPYGRTKLGLVLSTGEGKPQVEGDAYVKQVGVATPVGNLVEFSVEFTFTGEVTAGAKAGKKSKAGPPAQPAPSATPPVA